jgi:hypothetical protein
LLPVDGFVVEVEVVGLEVVEDAVVLGLLVLVVVPILPPDPGFILELILNKY